MRAARAWGVTYGEFHGRARTRRTVHYDPDGNPTGHSVTTVESGWDARQRSLALALLEYEDGCCPGCGGHLEETTAPEAEFAYRDPGPMRCHKCVAVGHAKRKFADEPEERLDGLLFMVERVPPYS